MDFPQTIHPKPKPSAATLLRLHLNGGLTDNTNNAKPPPSMIQVMHNNSLHSCDSSYSSQEDFDPILNIMNAPPPTMNSYLPRDFMPRSSGNRKTTRGGRHHHHHHHRKRDGHGKQQQQKERPPQRSLSEAQIRSEVDDDYWDILRKGMSPTLKHEDEPSVDNSANTANNKPILLRNHVSTHQLHHQTTALANLQKRQKNEIESILSTLSDLQNNYVSNDNSEYSPSISCSNPHDPTKKIYPSGSSAAHNSTPPREVRKEFCVRNFPNGDLFSGNVNVETQELIYGRMTCALEMEIYEGSFWKGMRHGEGAVCSKMDGGAKFLGR